MLVHEHLEYWARAQPERTAATDGIEQCSYRALDDRANQVGHALRGLGVERGSRFAVIAKNCLEWLALYYGAFKVGGVPVPLNTRLAPREWVHLLRDAGVRVLVAQDQFAPALDGIRDELPDLDHTVAIGRHTSWHAFDDLVDAQPTTPPPADLTPDDDLVQMYTSGTTGRPRGAVLTHRAVDASLFQKSMPLTSVKGRGALSVLPLFHIGGASGAMIHVARGARLHVMGDFDATTCVRLLDEADISIATLAPAMIQAMLVSVPTVADRRYDDLELVIYGASAIAEDTLRRAMEVFGCEFLQSYAMTEASASIAYLLPEDHRRALLGRPEILKACGRPLAGTELRVVDADDHDVPDGEVGEILVRGPQLMKGYWGLPDATAHALRGGWLHTGDAGRIDAEGYLSLSDRITDMIVSGGENVYPREIEDVLFELPQVADCAVIGVPDDRWGETVKAFVVVRAGERLSADEVAAWCRPRLAGFKQPRSVDFVADLPRSSSGKVLKRELREPHWAGRDRFVG